jgi:hypothetical protein
MPFINGQTGYLGELLDVNTGDGATSGQFLFYDGDEWVPNTADEAISNLSTRVLNLEIQQSVLPTQTDISNFTQSIMSRFNILDSSNDSQQDTIDKLVQGFSSLKKTINDLETAFIAHTGVSGAHDL